MLAAFCGCVEEIVDVLDPAAKGIPGEGRLSVLAVSAIIGGCPK
jgi:hypothetical protein